MKIRSTEKPHQFSDYLYNAIPIYELQGLTLDSDNNFTAGIEAVEYKPDEQLDLKTLFSIEKWKAKWSLCNHLSIPLYILTHKTGSKFIDVFRNSFDDDEIHFIRHNRLLIKAEETIISPRMMYFSRITFLWSTGILSTIFIARGSFSISFSFISETKEVVISDPNKETSPFV